MKLCSYGCGKEGTYYFKSVDKWCCSKHHSKCSEINKLSHKKKSQEKERFKSIEIITTKNCDYGCGLIAKYQFKNKKLCCGKHKSNCPVNNQSGRKNPMFGKNQSLESKKKMSENGKGRIPWCKGKTGIFSKETIKKISIYRTGKLLSEETKRKIGLKSKNNKANLGRKFSEDWINNMRKSAKKRGPQQREYMLNGGAVHAISFIENPSKPQVELYNRVKELYPQAVLNHPCYRGEGKKNYSLDVAIPELMIWFESDGSHWHLDEEKDLKRQREIEEFGWKIIRYKADYVKDIPSIERIKEDIEIITLKNIKDKQ